VAADLPPCRLFRLRAINVGPHVGEQIRELGGVLRTRKAESNSNDASQDGVFHGAYAAFIADKRFEKLAHFDFPVTRWCSEYRRRLPRFYRLRQRRPATALINALKPNRLQPATDAIERDRGQLF
jgi:hypothetical protein